MMRTLYVCAVLALLFGSIGCQGEKETASAQEAQERAEQRADAFKNQIEARMKILEKRTHNVRQQAETASAQLKTEAIQELENLEGQLAQLQNQLQEVKPEADAAWEQTKSTIELAMNRMEEWCTEVEQRLNR